MSLYHHLLMLLIRLIHCLHVSVYVYRICKGKPLGHGMARPCKACRNALRDMGINHLYYTGEDSFIYERLL